MVIMKPTVTAANCCCEGVSKRYRKVPMYCYDGQFWDVPKNFQFQKNPTRKVGWEYWIKGKPNNDIFYVDGENKADGEDDIFGAAFAPDPVYMEAARKNDDNDSTESKSEGNEKEKQQNESESDNDEVRTALDINASNATDRFSAAISTMLEAAAADGTSTDNK